MEREDREFGKLQSPLHVQHPPRRKYLRLAVERFNYFSWVTSSTIFFAFDLSTSTCPVCIFLICWPDKRFRSLTDTECLIYLQLTKQVSNRLFNFLQLKIAELVVGQLRRDVVHLRNTVLKVNNTIVQFQLAYAYHSLHNVNFLLFMQSVRFDDALTRSSMLNTSTFEQIAGSLALIKNPLL